MADTVTDQPPYTLTTAPVVVLRVWLAEAELAMHQLMIGKKAVSTSYEGKSASFTQANRDDLANWINLLKGRIAGLDGTPFARRRPIHLSF
ncbi:gpW family head-tail joining protein [Methylobacterium durans]|uniref:Phage tail protein n=1 Tax=Methylobacterium durans TaxID=2202825 RepID=A0A2U8WC11_9HYPH|nr:gpW family head-tail joining protein [Methylobacterium durans]AWN43158.1 hypothetical protein DK389_25020 [Methylobacterium durans]